MVVLGGEEEEGRGRETRAQHGADGLSLAVRKPGGKYGRAGAGGACAMAIAFSASPSWEAENYGCHERDAGEAGEV